MMKTPKYDFRKPCITGRYFNIMPSRCNCPAKTTVYKASHQEIRNPVLWAEGRKNESVQIHKQKINNGKQSQATGQ